MHALDSERTDSQLAACDLSLMMLVAQNSMLVLSYLIHAHQSLEDWGKPAAVEPAAVV